MEAKNVHLNVEFFKAKLVMLMLSSGDIWTLSHS